MEATLSPSGSLPILDPNERLYEASRKALKLITIIDLSHSCIWTAVFLIGLEYLYYTGTPSFAIELKHHVVFSIFLVSLIYLYAVKSFKTFRLYYIIKVNNRNLCDMFEECGEYCRFTVRFMFPSSFSPLLMVTFHDWDTHQDYLRLLCFAMAQFNIAFACILVKLTQKYSRRLQRSGYSTSVRSGRGSSHSGRSCGRFSENLMFPVLNDIDYMCRSSRVGVAGILVIFLLFILTFINLG